MTVSKFGTRKWYRNGQLHREDGPAIELPDGSREWWRDGKLHRTDGPAVEYARGTRKWYVNGEQLSETDFKRIYGR